VSDVVNPESVLTLWTALQTTPPVSSGPGALTSLLSTAVGSFLTTLAVGAILVAVVPEFTERTMASVVEEPIGSFAYGIASLILLALVIGILVLTIVGIVLAAPLALLAYLVWAVGASIAFLAIADRLVGHESGWTKPLLIGAGLNGLLTLTGIGGLVTFGFGAAGFGAVLRGYL